MPAADRRTVAAQLDDRAIELMAANRVKEAIGDRGHVNVTSYNRGALLTGEVHDEADKAAVEAAVRRIDKVRSTVNELGLLPIASADSRSTDAAIAKALRDALDRAGDVPGSTVKAVVERRTAYLMGRVTEREAMAATTIARQLPRVGKVVRSFEIIDEAELAGPAR